MKLVAVVIASLAIGAGIGWVAHRPVSNANEHALALADAREVVAAQVASTSAKDGHLTSLVRLVPNVWRARAVLSTGLAMCFQIHLNTFEELATRWHGIGEVSCSS